MKGTAKTKKKFAKEINIEEIEGNDEVLEWLAALMGDKGF